jgi:serine/threonine protein kinase
MDAPGTVPQSINCHACGAAIDLTGQTGFTHIECPSCTALSIVPVQFGQFLLLSTLGIGGMGTVYKAIDLSLNRYLALKILRKKLANMPDFIENFTREARAAAAVNHSNVAQVYSFGEQDGQYYLAMELLERGSLDDRMARVGKLPENDVLDFGVQVAMGLRAAHQRDLLHRDIKPGNVLFNDDGVPKLVDFGLARPPAVGPISKHNPPTEPIWGTPYYIAPEKLLGNPEDARSDIYSLGATLYHALAGRPPFDARTADEVVAKHATTPAYSLKTYAPNIHPFTAHVIARMLAKNPAERYNNCDEVINDLQQAQKFLAQANAQRTVVTSTGERVPLRQILITAAAVLGCASVLIFMWVRREQIFGSEQHIPTPPPPPSNTGTVSPPASLTNKTATTHGNVGVVAPRGAVVDFNEATPWVNAWKVATLQLAQGRYDDAELGYEGLLAQLGFSRPRQAQWIQFYRCLALVTADRPGEARKLLAEKAQNRSAPREIPQDITTGNFIDTLVQVMLDEIPLSTLHAAETNMPVWAVGLSELTEGFKHIERGAFGKAAESFRSYVKTEPREDQRWAFNLQPLADGLARSCDSAVNALQNISQLEKDEKYEEALAAAQKELEAARFVALKSELQDRISRFNSVLEAKRAKQEEEQQRKAEEEARQQAERDAREAEMQKRVQGELDIVNSIDKQLTSFWPKYDFKSAQAKLDTIKAQLKTKEAQDIFNRKLASFKLLGDFKNQLMADLARRPFDGSSLETRTGTKLDGRVVRANDNQLILSTPYGELVTDWRDLSPGMLEKMGQFYLNAFAPTEKPEQRAQRCVQLAVFCKQYGMDREAVVFGRQAVQFNPAIQDQVDSLLQNPSANNQ